MENLFTGMRPVEVYWDDILVTGTDDEDHLQNLQSILAEHSGTCRAYWQIILNVLAPVPRKVEAVLKAPKPQNKKELQGYLGLYLSGRTFEAVTNHKPLLGVLGLDKAVPVQLLSRSAVSQATSRDLVLSQVVKVVSQREELAERTYSHKAAELSQQQGCMLCGSRGVIPQSLQSREIARMVQCYQVCQENQ
ncbi:uncharacterized protein LOC144167944 [Haemaphysalis longicornis]